MSNCLKYGFHKSLRKEAPLTSLNTFFITKVKRVHEVLQVPFCDEKSVQLVRASEVHLSEVTFYKIHTLVIIQGKF